MARPSIDNEQERFGEELKAQAASGNVGSPLDHRSLSRLLESRFPGNKEASEKGIAFGLELARLCNLQTIESLEAALEVVDGEQVLALMDASGPVTRVRRLDDELLARFGEDYIRLTGTAGSVSTRAQQLEWRFDRLRGKARYKAYFIHGSDRPEDLESGPHTAARAVRALAILVAQEKGVDTVINVEGVSRADDLPKGARAKEAPVNANESIWVITNLNRGYSEFLMKELLDRVPDLDLEVVRDDTVVAGNSGR
ncbi:hypothetical protein M1E17_16290 [Arthrobacter sp. D1-29]